MKKKYNCFTCFDSAQHIDKTLIVFALIDGIIELVK